MMLKQVPFNVSIRLHGDAVEYRVEMIDSRRKGGVTRLKVVPFCGGKLFSDRGRWLDWETEVELYHREEERVVH